MRATLLLILVCAGPAVAGRFDADEEAEAPKRESPRPRGGGKLIATGGTLQVEGAGGGGIVPWALLAGYGTRNQIGNAFFFTHVRSNDLQFNAAGVALTFRDRLELSYARQEKQLTGGGFAGSVIRQHVLGAKLRLLGDAIFTQDSWLPQLALGAQHKRNLDFAAIPRVLGARAAEGTDLYVAATKLLMGAALGRNLLLSGALRLTKANQLGLLGFGGDKSGAYKPMWESSIGVFLDDHIVLGAEYRMKPDNLSSAREDDWADVSLACFFSKNLAATVAYAKMGSVGGRDQNGPYLSVQANF